MPHLRMRIARHRALAAVAAAALSVGIAAQVGLASGSDPGPLPETEKALAAGSGVGALPSPAAVAGALDEHGSATVTHVANVREGTGGHVVVEGDRLYVGSYGFGMHIFDIGDDPANPRPIGRYIPGPDPAERDPGLRADTVPDAAVLDGRHIVALGGTSRAASTQQTEFVDATDPASPTLLWRFRGPADGEAHNSDIVDARRWWLPSGGRGQHGLRIYDLAPLLGDTPEAPANLFRGDPVALWEASPFRGDREVGPAFTHTHDIEVYTDRQVLLPEDQWFVPHEPSSRGRGQGKGRLARQPEPQPTYAERDIALVAEGGSYLDDDGNTGSIFVVDITDPADPVVLNRWLHTDEEGHHPIRYFHEVQFLDGQPDVLVVTDEDLHNTCDAGGVTFLRVSEDLTEATELSEWFIGLGTPAPVCSAHVFSSHESYIFMGSYNAGLQVIDVRDPANPTKAAELIMEGANSWGALWHEGYIYVGDFGSRGLDVFTFTP